MSAFDGLATVGIYSNYKGKLYEQLAEQVIDEHLLDNVQLLGFRDNPYPYMAADFHCHGSQNTRCRWA